MMTINTITTTITTNMVVTKTMTTAVITRTTMMIIVMMIQAQNVLKIQMTNAVQWWKHYTSRSATPKTGNHTTITALLMGNERNITRALKAIQFTKPRRAQDIQ